MNGTQNKKLEAALKSYREAEAQFSAAHRINPFGDGDTLRADRLAQRRFRKLVAVGAESGMTEAKVAQWVLNTDPSGWNQ